MLSEQNELALEAAEEGAGGVIADLELVPHFVVKVLQELPPRGGHGGADLEVQL